LVNMSDKVKRILVIAAKILIIVLIILFFTRAVKYIVPFIVAYIFASLIEPIVKFLERKTPIPRKVCTVFSILIVLGIILSIFSFLIYRLVKEIQNVYNSLALNMETISLFFNQLIEKINGIYIQLPAEISDFISQSAKNLASDLQSILKGAIDIAQVSLEFALNIPQVFIFILVTILATYFMSSDKNKILGFLDVNIPSDWMRRTRNITQSIFTALFGWLKAQLIIMTITFTELLIGLLIIGIENSLLIALIIALVDILPILGAGTVLIPWAIINLLTSNTKLGLSLLLLYIIILFVRQLIEPKIVGHQIGVHPLFTLAGMYIGLQRFGVLGMILGPIAVVFLKYIFNGIFQNERFKEWYEKYFGKRENPAPESVVIDHSAVNKINKKTGATKRKRS
jgi:sporulation integral membrane protein YtvI